MKQLFTFSLFLFASLFIHAQTPVNTIDIERLASPIANFNYMPGESPNITITVTNVGPNALLGNDSLVGNVTLSSPDTFLIFQYKAPIVNFFNVDQTRNFDIDSAFTINDNQNYSLCVDVSGSVFYNNDSKNQTACASFVVGNREQVLKLDELSYRNGSFQFTFRQAAGENIQLEVLNLLGQQLRQEQLVLDQEGKGEFFYQPDQGGIYFLRLRNENGALGVGKIAIH